ncbi:hypothetical protein QYE76_034452 [Lolium multiflorum]|uniref:CCHC-type domain-containing protein n=1 Tax=Lolium multiflorum TaxID=4521 RepID=A0AAD8QZN4_LOLMU|nr:hypothetical protein QYE76_034452 [Lolium multiflorum]
MDVERDKELDMKISHGRAREEREACAREDEVQAGPAPGRTGRHARSLARSNRRWAGSTRRQRGPLPAGRENKDSVDIITWREFEALQNEMRREFRVLDDVLNGKVEAINQKLDATNATVTTMADQVTDIQRNLTDMRLAIENLTTQQQQDDDEDPELQDDAHNAHGAPRGNRPRGWAPHGRNGRGQDEEDGLGVKTVDEYYMEMEMLMQRGCVRESLEMTMQRFLNGLKSCYGSWAFYTPRAPIHGAGAFGRLTTPPSKPVSNVSNAKKSESAASTSGSSMSTARNRDMLCNTCGGKGHFKRDCPNRKVMIINEDNEYETGDDGDPNAPEDDDYDTDGEDAYPSDARTIVVSQRVLNMLPSASTQRCNLFQTKALVGPDKACKVIIDGGSCRNLASKELCTKLKLKYLPHPHPYYIQWLSDNGEMKSQYGGIKRADFVKKIHVKTKELIEKKGKSNAARKNKKRKEMLFKPGDMVWVHFRKDRFPKLRKSKLQPRGADLGASRSTPFEGGDDEDIPTSLLPPSLPTEDEPAVKLKYEEETSIAREREEQLDVKIDVELDKELDMKISHGRAREEREALIRLQQRLPSAATIAKLNSGEVSVHLPGRGSAPEAISIDATASIMLRE